jgi:myo-inositol 2-dehydrogenase/D-chiro-inositol 1-dehydrogenase
MAVFRLGLVGAGRMGQAHLRALAGSERIRISALADPSPGIREALEGPGIATFADVETMLRKSELDGALIAAPSPLHLANVVRLVDAGLPILCEKPCGVTANEARAAASSAAKGGVLLQVAYWRRFVPALKKLKDSIGAGDLGDLYFVTSSQWDEQPPPAAFRATSGGIFIDMGVHEFDQIRWLTGQEFKAIHVSRSGVAGDALVPGDAESAQALCDLSGGSTALVSLGRRFARGDVCWVEVFGTKASEDCRFLWPPEADATFRTALRLQAEGFVDATEGKPTEGATAADAIAALVAAEEASATFRTDDAIAALVAAEEASATFRTDQRSGEET